MNIEASLTEFIEEKVARYLEENNLITDAVEQALKDNEPDYDSLVSDILDDYEFDVDKIIGLEREIENTVETMLEQSDLNDRADQLDNETEDLKNRLDKLEDKCTENQYVTGLVTEYFESKEFQEKLENTITEVIKKAFSQTNVYQG